MAAKQTRRSISVRGMTYDNLRDYCGAHGRSMSDVVEELLGQILPASQSKVAPRPVVADKVSRKREVAVEAAAAPVDRSVEAEEQRPAVASKPSAVGRPAPTPVPVAKARTGSKKDYRNISF